MKTQIGERLIGLISTLIDERNEKGFETYKETLDDVPFENYNWEMMIIEELLDGLQYMLKENERLRNDIKELQGMRLSEYQEISKRTMPSDGYGRYTPFHKSNYALGVNGEAGELGEIVKKNVHHGHPFNREKFVKEAGDVMHYLAGICTMYDVTLDEVCTMNVFKLSKRYPNGFSSEASMARVDELDVCSMYPSEQILKKEDK